MSSVPHECLFIFRNFFPGPRLDPGFMGARWLRAQNVQVASHKDQLPGRDLGDPVLCPFGQFALIDFTVLLQLPLEGVDDRLEEESLAPRVATMLGKNDPVRIAHSDQRELG
jgi:hypothetical protein